MCDVGCTEYRPCHLPGMGGRVLIPPMSMETMAVVAMLVSGSECDD